MMKLRVLPEGLNCASMSPFSVKAMLLMHASGADWRRDVKNDPRKAPKGKLPVLVDGDEIIPDTWAIRAHLEARLGVDFDAGLSKKERGIGHALARMAEEHLYFAGMHDRWINDDHWVHIREAYFGAIPAVIRGMVTRSMRKGVARDLNGPDDPALPVFLNIAFGYKAAH